MDQQNIPIIKPETSMNNIPQNQIPISRPAIVPVNTVATVSQPATVPSVEISLPSRGWFYAPENPLSSGKISIKIPGAKEEDLLVDQSAIKKGQVLDNLLKAVIITPGVELESILIGDKNRLFLKCREEMYGKIYESKIKCNSCGEETLEKVDISLLKDKEFNFENYQRGANQFEYELPFSKKRITYKLLCHADEAAIDSELKALSKFNKGNSSEITSRLKYLCLAIDGNTDRNFIKKYIDQSLSAKDSLELRKYIRANSPDVDMQMQFNCSNCNHQEEMTLPLSISFFWPSTDS